MSDVEHRSLTGSSLHDLKGVSSAADYEVPVAISGASDFRKLDHNSLTTTGNAFGAQLLHVRDNAALGTNGGSVTLAWADRTLDTVVTNEITGASLSASQLSLPAGTYHAKIIAPGYKVGAYRIRLRDVTSNVTLLESPSAYAGATNDAQVYAAHEGRFTLAAAKKVRLQHIGSVANAGDGGGKAGNIGTSETYAQVYIWKVR